jgi:beta-galactosidase
MKASFRLMANRTVVFLLLCLALTSPEVRGVPPDSHWPRPVIVPEPESVAGCDQPVLSLNGAWKFSLHPPREFWKNLVDPSSWSTIQVPGEALMQGFNISKDREFAYRRQIAIPAAAEGGKIILRFDGVYSFARIWIDGRFVRDHTGGFTSWDCDITRFVSPGRPAWLTVGVTDRSDEISWGSEYAKHNIGGILRSVKLIVLPRDHISRIHAETELDDNYKNALLKVSAGVSFAHAREAEIRLSLTGPSGETVGLERDSFSLTAGSAEMEVALQVRAPRLWDAEHPELYTLRAVLLTGGRQVQSVAGKIGFREVVRAGNRLLVNGREIKLRGVNRHDVHPTRGRSITPELDERDVLLFREANVNFIRTSHYPPSEAFLEACDRYGMYVEEETAVCFVGTHGNGPTADDTQYTKAYLGQLAEMIERDRSHPSVIIWSIGNENVWGENFRLEYEYVKQEDPSRPVIFSYPQRVPGGLQPYDIYSYHYFDVTENPAGQSVLFPVLHDEFAHVACYDVNELRRDPGVRDFWGGSIERFWDDIYTAEGALGGAIWGGIDDVFQVPVPDHILTESTKRSGFNKYGYGQWGIIDGWRRRKPEFWHTQKAYSPIHIKNLLLAVPGQGESLAVPVENRFDHTNLDELGIFWKADTDSGAVENLFVAPHSQGLLQLPARPWKDGETLNLRFYRQDSLLVDEYNLPVGEGKRADEEPAARPPVVEETAAGVRISGPDFSVEFSRATGLITRGAFKGLTIIESGPHLNLVMIDPSRKIGWEYDAPPGESGIDSEDWLPGSFAVTSDSTRAVVQTAGAYGNIGVKYEIRVDGRGAIGVSYTIINPSIPPPSRGYSEVGLSFILSSGIDRLAWERRGLWSAYPDGHIGRSRGLAHKFREGGREEFGKEPGWPWGLDMKDFYLFGPGDRGNRGTRDFRGTKANIHKASALLAGSQFGVRAESDGSDAVRLALQEPSERARVVLTVNNLWNYPNLLWGNYMKEKIFLQAGYSGRVSIRLTEEALERGN